MEEFFMNLEFTNLIWQIVTPLLFSLVDILTGYIQAVINKNVDSQKMREGLWHKFLLILIIFLSYVMTFAFGVKQISVIVALYICLMESVSITENLSKAGIDFPITKYLNVKKGEEENEIK